jgi:multiple antibiotic resistance protein
LPAPYTVLGVERRVSAEGRTIIEPLRLMCSRAGGVARKARWPPEPQGGGSNPPQPASHHRPHHSKLPRPSTGEGTDDERTKSLKWEWRPLRVSRPRERCPMATELLNIQELVKAVIALFVVVDPLGLVPTFTGLTHGMTPEVRRRTFRTGVYTAAALLLTFALAGHQILLLFGITLQSFMIAGGVLLLILSVEIIVAGSWHQRVTSTDEVGVFPIGFPLLVGPGAITTTMVTLQSAGFITTLLAVIIVMLVTWLILEKIEFVYRLLGRRGSGAIAKIMAVFIAAIAIQFILTGLQFYYPPARA